MKEFSLVLMILVLTVVIVLFIISCDEKTTESATSIAPSNFEILVTNPSTILLYWTDQSNNEEGFKIDRKRGDNEWVVEYLTLTENTTSVNDTISSSIDYSYRLYSYIGDENSSYLSQHLTIDFPPPTNLELTQLSLTSVLITWTDNCENENGYIIDRKLNDNDWELEYFSCDENTTSITDNNAPHLTEITYRVHAFSGSYSSNSIESTVRTNPILIGSINIEECIHDIFVIGDFTYLITGYSYGGFGGTTLQIVNTSDIHNPIIMGSIDVENGPKRLFISEQYAYIGTNSGLCIVDISNPNFPSMIHNNFNIGFGGNYCRDIVAINNIVYFLWSSWGLFSVDVSNPFFPENLSSSCTSNSDKSDFAINNNIAIVLEEYISFVDISDPSNIFELESYDGYYLSTDINNYYAFFSYGNIVILNISDPLNPIEISTCGLTGAGYETIYQDNLLFVLVFEGGGDQWAVNIIDANNVNEPKLIGEKDISGSTPYVTRFDLFNQYILVATQNDGVQIIQFEP